MVGGLNDFIVWLAARINKAEKYVTCNENKERYNYGCPSTIDC